jgi:hypothetical protein
MTRFNALLTLLLTVGAASSSQLRPKAERNTAARGRGRRARIEVVSSRAKTSTTASSTPTTTSSGNGSATLLWSTHTPGTWYTGSALVAPSEGPSGSDGLAMLVSGGDYFDAPYPFFVYGGDAMTGAASFNATSVWPGSVWPTGGLGVLSPYTSTDFTSFAGGLAAFRPDTALPVWADTINTPTDNVWETGPAAVASQDGSVVAASVTLIPDRNPTGTKTPAVIAVRTGFPATALINDAQFPNGTGLELLELSADGSVLVAGAAIQNADGSIHTSLIRVYDVKAGTAITSFVTPYAYASCLSADGTRLVLATTDSEDRIDVYDIDVAGGGMVTLLTNSSYPSSLPGTFQYVAACSVSDAGLLMATFAIFWGDSMNQTIVGSYLLPSSPVPTPLTPTWLWASNPVDASLQDDPMSDAMLADGSVYAYISWGGQNLNATSPDAPPTLHVFRTGGGAGTGPVAVVEVSTPAPGQTGVSGSLTTFDMAPAPDGNGVVVFASGVDGHRNVGSAGGLLYAWRVVV